MKKKTIAILYYEINFKNCYNFAKQLNNEYNIIFISTAFFDTLTDLDNNKKKLDKLKIKNYSFKDELLYFYKNINKKNTINKKYLKNFENKYLKNRKVADLISFDYFMNEKNNPREDVLFHKNKKKKFFLAECLLKKIEKILKLNDIDIFFSMSPLNFINNCFFEICQKRQKKFISTFVNRDNTITLTDNFGLNFPNYIKKQINNSNLKIDSNIRKYIKKKLLYSKKDSSNIENLFLGVRNELCRLLEHFLNLKKFIDREFNYIKTRKTLGVDTKYYYQRSQISLFFIHLRYILRSFTIHFKIFINSKKLLKTKKYIYVPLHYFPEAYIFNQKNFDEIKMINLIAKKVPNNVYIVIKPHPLFFMSGYEQHKVKYFKKMLENKNVLLTSPYTGNISLIKNAIATITFIGTSALQSILLGKPAYIMGNCELNYFNNINNFKDFNYDKNLLYTKIDNEFNYKILYFLRKNSIKTNHALKKNKLIELKKNLNLILDK